MGHDGPVKDHGDPMKARGGQALGHGDPEWDHGVPEMNHDWGCHQDDQLRDLQGLKWMSRKDLGKNPHFGRNYFEVWCSLGSAPSGFLYCWAGASHL